MIGSTIDESAEGTASNKRDLVNRHYCRRKYRMNRTGGNEQAAEHAHEVARIAMAGLVQRGM
jgi:hypothetical protein